MTRLGVLPLPLFSAPQATKSVVDGRRYLDYARVER